MNNPKDTLEEQPILNSDNPELVKEEVANMTDEEKQMSSEAEASEVEVSDEDKLVQLKEFRKNGNVTLDVSYSSFKMMRNIFKNKVAWTGPNQAYLLCVLNMNMERNTILYSVDYIRRTENCLIKFGSTFPRGIDANIA